MHKQNIYFVLELLINRKLDLKKEYTQIAKLAKSTYYKCVAYYVSRIIAIAKHNLLF